MYIKFINEVNVKLSDLLDQGILTQGKRSVQLIS